MYILVINDKRTRSIQSFFNITLDLLAYTRRLKQQVSRNTPRFSTYVLGTFWVPFTYLLRTFYVRLHKFLHHIQESYLTLSNQYFCIILVRDRYQFDAGFPYALELHQLQYYTCIPSYFEYFQISIFKIFFLIKAITTHH